MAMDVFNMFDPTIPAAKEPIDYVPRPRELEGLRVGLVENTKYRSRDLLLMIAEPAQAKIPHGDDPHLHQEIRRQPGGGRGNRGIQGKGVTLSSPGSAIEGPAVRASVLDGILLEKAGMPAVSIVTEPFVVTGREMAKSWGVGEYQFLEMPHPIANLTEEELNAQADDLVAKVLKLLREGQPRA